MGNAQYDAWVEGHFERCDDCWAHYQDITWRPEDYCELAKKELSQAEKFLGDEYDRWRDDELTAGMEA